jgi:deoxycytidylate deaminase
VDEDRRRPGPDHPVEPIPELYFATVRAIGTPVGEAAIAPLEEVLSQVNFALATVKLAASLPQTEQDGRPFASAFDRYARLMNAGDRIRQDAKDGSAVSIEGIRQLHDSVRETARQQAITNQSTLGIAYLFRNLMHPAEVDRLRRLYDRQFFVISIFSPEERRVSHLKEALAKGAGRIADHDFNARFLVQREIGHYPFSRGLDVKRIRAKKLVLNIEQTFYRGDLFVDASDVDLARDQIKRFVRLIFREPFHTPTPDEIGMAEAWGAMLESGNVARRVGAAICSPEGELLVTGTNDVPKPGGGVYREGEDPDHRDHDPNQWGYDSSDRHRRQIVTNFMQHLLADANWLSHIDHPAATDLATFLEDDGQGRQGPAPNHSLVSYSDLVTSLVQSDVIRNSEIFDMVEYGRTLHAEMDAITSAARKGVSIKGCTLYCTTLPCHECARLIIGSGIRQVVFIEPYEKSRASELYKTEIRFTGEAGRGGTGRRVEFVPYVGISPSRFEELFSSVPRKSSDADVWLEGVENVGDLSGDVVKWREQQELLGRYAGILRRGKLQSPITTEPPIVRESLVSPGSFIAPEHFLDIYDYEAKMVEEFDSRRQGAGKQNKPAPDQPG